MNKKKQVKCTKERTSGGKQKNAAPRVHTRTSKPLKERGLQESKWNICNDRLFTKPPGKMASRRGRPRSRKVEHPSMIMYMPMQQVEQQRQPKRQRNTCRIGTTMPTHGSVVQATQQPEQFRAQIMSIIPSPNKNQESKKKCLTDGHKWPQDLEQLVIEWDHLPEGHLWEVIKWLKASEVPTETKLPLMVANIQKKMAEWDDVFENKVQDILNWLGYGIPRPQKESEPLKVVVESVQVCSQWSSMADQSENREP